MKHRHLVAAVLLAIGADASAGSSPQRAVQTAPFPGLAYAAIAPSSEYGRFLFGSGTEDVGPLQTYFFSGGFANNDFTHEYAVDYPSADLYSIDTSDASTTLIGNIGLPHTEIAGAGPKWDPISGNSFLWPPTTAVARAACIPSIYRPLLRRWLASPPAPALLRWPLTQWD